MIGPEQPKSTFAVPDDREEFVCGPDFCAEGDPLASELTVDQEVQFDAFDDAARDWSLTLDDARELAMLLHGFFDQHERANRHKQNVIEKTAGTKLATYLLYDGGGVGNKVDYIASVRRSTADGIRSRATAVTGEASIETVLLEGEKGQLEALRDQLQEEMAAAMRNSRLDNQASRFLSLGSAALPVENPYAVLFYRELVARTELALVVRESPAFVADIISPRQLTNLSDYMQQLLALDINTGNHSVILKFAKHQAHASETFFDYLNENSLTASAREDAQTMAVVAKALGSCACPLNSLGICREVADAIPPAQLPKDIRDDMFKKQHGATEQTLARLRALGQSKRVSSWWNFSTAILPRTNQLPPSKRKRQTSAPTIGTASSFDRSLDKPLQHETVAPTSVHVSWKGLEEVRVACVDEKNAIATIVEEMLEDKMFQNYINSHREQVDLPDFIRNALTHILIAPAYRQRQTPIRQCVNEEPRRSRVDDQLLKVWRLSGANFPGGGKIGRDTRIYFGHEGREAVRRIEIIKISHKADTVHQFKASRSII